MRQSPEHGVRRAEPAEWECPSAAAWDVKGKTKPQDREKSSRVQAEGGEFGVVGYQPIQLGGEERTVQRD